MRDFPVFTTENGVGSLVLKEIPYRSIAYVTIQDSACPEVFLEECTGFCRAVGAERIYATGHAFLDRFPLYTSVVRMTGSLDAIPVSDACLFPVTDVTLPQWREIYNDRLRNVDNASYMTEADAKRMLGRGDGYFIHRDSELLGIGIASPERIDCVASVKAGCGREVVSALAHGLCNQAPYLEVASTNNRAIRLYESLGFVKTAEISRWYKIF